MIKFQIRQLLLTTFLLLSSVSHADVTDESLNKIMVLSGLTKQVSQYPGVIKIGLDQARQQGASIPEAEFSLMLASVDKSILPSDILDQVRESLKASISNAEANQLLSWYESAPGKEITKAEEIASTPEAVQEVMQLAPTLLENTEGVTFAKTLDALMGATELTMDIQEFAGLAVYSAITTAMQPGVPLDIEPYKVQMKAARAQTRATVEQWVIISYVYAYQDIDASTLKKYEGFLNETTTAKFNNAVRNGLNKGLEMSISKWADSLAAIFKNKRSLNQQA